MISNFILLISKIHPIDILNSSYWYLKSILLISNFILLISNFILLISNFILLVGPLIVELNIFVAFVWDRKLHFQLMPWWHCHQLDALKVRFSLYFLFVLQIFVILTLYDAYPSLLLKSIIDYCNQDPDCNRNSMNQKLFWT